jgi:hypothetical protein
MLNRPITSMYKYFYEFVNLQNISIKIHYFATPKIINKHITIRVRTYFIGMGIKCVDTAMVMEDARISMLTLTFVSVKEAVVYPIF